MIVHINGVAYRIDTDQQLLAVMQATTATLPQVLTTLRAEQHKAA